MVASLGAFNRIIAGNASSAVAALDDLTDVTLTSPARGHRLRRGATDWINSPFSEEVASAVTASTATTNLNGEAADYFDVTLSANTTIDITGSLPSSGYCHPKIVRLTQDGTGGRTVTWHNSIKWAGAIAPVLTTTAGAVAVLCFVTYDGGATWQGALMGDDIR